MTELISNNPFFYALSLTLIHFLWQGALVALVLKLVFQCIPYQKPQARYIASTVAMLVSLLLPIITFYNLYNPSYLDELGVLQTQSIDSIASIANFAEQEFWYNQLIEYLPYLSVAWIATVLLLAAKLLLEVYSVNRLSKLAIVSTPVQLEEKFSQLVRQLNLSQSPKLLISLKANVPMAIGWLRPVVLLPASMLTGLTPAQLDMLILHELAHIKRYDYLVNFLQTLVETLLFFHPAVIWISNQMRNEREYCSDDIAVKACGNAVAYAHTLTETAAHCHKHRHSAIPDMAMAASGGDLKQRVLRLVDQHHCASVNPLSKWLASGLTLTVLSFAMVQLVSVPLVDPVTDGVSLFRAGSNTEFSAKNSTSPQMSPVLAQTTLAQQLLSKEKVEFAKQPSEEVLKINKLSPEPFVAPKIVKAQPVSVKELKVNTQKIAKQKKSVTEPNQLTFTQPQKQSIASQAFARTESKPKTENLSSPYGGNYNQVNDDLNNSQATRTHIYSMTSPLLAVNSSQPKLLKEHKQEATLISSVSPKYPSTAKRRGIELDVTVHFTVDDKGKVANIEFDSKGRVSYFRSAIKSALAKWHFLPAAIDGKPVETKMTKIFSFSLEN